MVTLPSKSSGWKHILLFIFPYFVIVGLFQWLGYIVARLDITRVHQVKSPFEAFIVTFFSLAGTFLTVWIFRKYVDRKSIASLGFVRKYIGRDLLLGLVFGFVIILTGFTCLVISGQIQIQNVNFSLTDLLLSLGLFVFVAVTEELLIRGYVLNNMMVSFNKYVALAISSLVFSILHLANPNISLLGFTELFLSGILLGISYIYTQSLWFPIALHFSWNFFQGTIFGFNVSGIEQYNLIVTKYEAANIWNGGTFGFEGSVLSLGFQLIAIVFIVHLYKNREQHSERN